MGSAAEWHAFLDDFRGFGGRAENVMQRKGNFGMGLFPIDPSKPVDLHIPSSLLVPVENTELQDGNVVIKDDQDFPEGYSDWFQKYQETYSWGAEGKEKTMAFEQGLKALPDDVQNLLNDYGLYNADIRYPEKDPEQETLRRFIQTRCINFQQKKVIMPIIDLVNHSPSVKSYDINGEGIAISGIFEGEVLVRYNLLDPIRRLLGYGFNAQEMMGYSLRCRIQHQDHIVIVQGGQSSRPMQPCKATFQKDRFVVEQPLLGSVRSPRMPRTLFLKACNGVEGINANELFDQIHQFNTIALARIVRELESSEGETASLLRQSCLDQLVAQSHCYGVRQDVLDE